MTDRPTSLAAVRTFGSEVVLVDLGLPAMDGYQVARKLREEHGDKKILQSDAARLKRAGFDQHLTKPTRHAEAIGLARGV